MEAREWFAEKRPLGTDGHELPFLICIGSVPLERKAMIWIANASDK